MDDVNIRAASIKYSYNETAKFRRHVLLVFYLSDVCVRTCDKYCKPNKILTRSIFKKSSLYCFWHVYLPPAQNVLFSLYTTTTGASLKEITFICNNLIEKVKLNELRRKNNNYKYHAISIVIIYGCYI